MEATALMVDAAACMERPDAIKTENHAHGAGGKRLSKLPVRQGSNRR
jgi:hypothetical protein